MISDSTDLKRIFLLEIYKRRNVIFIIFAFISVSFLAVGSVWPKKYTASAVIVVVHKNIIQPLMEGAAVPTSVADHAKNAKEIIHSRRIIDAVLDEGGWLEEYPEIQDQERIRNKLIKEIKIRDAGENLIRISFTDSSAERAYKIVTLITNMFIKEGKTEQIEESQAAYEFIEEQVQKYLKKLTEVEEALTEFRTKNPDARPGLESEVSTKIADIQSRIEATKLELKETEIKKKSLQDQLSGEAAITISQSREGQYRSQIADLNSQLETLRLDYQDTYPDIVRIKHQISDLKEALHRELERREKKIREARKSGKTYIDDAIVANPLYQQLRTDLSTTETKIATLNARISQLQQTLKNEFDKSRKIYDGEAELKRLMRNYKVNQDIYQDLLKRRESARVSKSLDQDSQGLTFKVQESAEIPVLPQGIRFIHFVILGLLLGTGIPLSLLYGMLMIDPRVRDANILTEELGIPVLSEIPVFSNKITAIEEKKSLIALGIGLLGVMCVYGVVMSLKVTGNL